MSPKLKPLLLPLLVEERRKRESSSDSEMDLSSSSFYTQNSSASASEFPSPVTPTFSARHMRYPSSISSIGSSLHGSVVESPSSPPCVPKSGKRSLPDVIEEGHEREEEINVLDDENELYDCLCDHPQCLHRERPVVQRSEQLPTKLAFDYDFADGFLSEEEYSMSPRLKKRAIEPPFTGLATRIGTRFPSFSRKWRLRRGTNSPCISPEALRNSATSRGASSRSSSVSHSAQQAWEQSSFGPQCPPTPTKSVFGGSSHENLSQTNPIDIERTNTNGDEPDERFATTPLLPPLMSDASANTNHVPMPSPLQSPSVAEPNDDPFLEGGMPMDATTSQYAVMPSPPLSTKPSTSSFHRNNLNWSGQHTTTEMIIVDMNDEWADKLGHANFTIYPEPYVPERFDLEACRQLRANWDRARCNYTKHLVRIGEHYGATSKTYKLTEEKWAAIESTWRKNNELTIANTVENSSDAFATLKHTTLGDGSNNIMTKIPSLNDPRGGGKFPQLGDEDIVGPMVQVTAQLHRTPSKKTKLFKFITEKFPVGLGKS